MNILDAINSLKWRTKFCNCNDCTATRKVLDNLSAAEERARKAEDRACNVDLCSLRKRLEAELIALRAELTSLQDKYNTFGGMILQRDQLILSLTAERDALREKVQKMDFLYHLGNPSQVHDDILEALREAPDNG